MVACRRRGSRMTGKNDPWQLRDPQLDITTLGREKPVPGAVTLGGPRRRPPRSDGRRTGRREYFRDKDPAPAGRRAVCRRVLDRKPARAGLARLLPRRRPFRRATGRCPRRDRAPAKQRHYARCDPRCARCSGGSCRDGPASRKGHDLGDVGRCSHGEPHRGRSGVAPWPPNCQARQSCRSSCVLHQVIPRPGEEPLSCPHRSVLQSALQTPTCCQQTRGGRAESAPAR